MYRHGIFSILLVFLMFQSSSGQFYSTGQAPFAVKWKQIKTENFQIIFPEEFIKEANRVANILEYMYTNSSRDYERKAQKISIVLHNRSVLSNGYVSWAPKRSEWVTTPPQRLYAQDWLEQLAIHEFRHVLQLSNLDQGITRLLRLLFGEAAVGAVAGYLPLWFYEGDAVLAETAMTLTGRGRESDFDREIRTIESEKARRFSYDQSYLGSYKYKIPNHYSYGYQMVSYAQLKYNNNFWNQVIKTTAYLPFAISPFYLGLIMGGAKSKSDLYHETFDSLKIMWNSEIKPIKSSYTSNIFISRKKDFTNYNHVQVKDAGYFAVRSGMDDITRFVLLKDSVEKVIFTPGSYLNTRVALGKKYLCWEEYQLDCRWHQQSFNNLYLLDLETSKKICLKRKVRWFSPDISPGEDKLVCISINLKNEYSLIIVEIPSGNIVQNIPLLKFQQAQSPVWVAEDEIAFIGQDKSGKSIVKLKLSGLQMENLYSAGYHNIDYLRSEEELLFFTCDREKERNIYVLDRKDNTISRVTTSAYGVDYPSIDTAKNELLVSDYSLMGYRPVRISLDSVKRVSMNRVEEYSYPWANSHTQNAGFIFNRDSVPSENYPYKSYRKVFHGFNFHSWAPFYIDPYQVAELYPKIFPGFTLMSQNKLSTLTTLISYYFTEGTHHFEPRIIYQGLYPVFELSMEITSKEEFYNWDRNIPRPFNPEGDKSVELSTYLPLNFSRNKWQRYLKPELSFNYHHRYYYTDIAKLGYNYLEGSLSAYNYLKQGRRDLQPRFGQNLYIAYNSPLKSRDYFSSILVGRFQQYLPGMLRHHGVKIGCAFEKQQVAKSPLLYNRISLPRGYDATFLYKQNIKLSSDYTFPLFNPDWSVGPLIYMKRFYMSLYFDAARVNYLEEYKDTVREVEQNFYSFGMILAGEMHFLRFFMPFHPKFRISYLPVEERFDFGFDINIDSSGY